MAISVVMPALEMAQETGKLLVWRKKEGEPTVKGEPLLEIETDKAVVEVEAAADGILAGVMSREGDVVPVGSIIAWILQPGESLPTEAAGTGNAAPTARAVSAAASVASAAAAPSGSSFTAANAAATAKLSPKARRLAKEHGVDVSKVAPTGPDGSITTEDILAFVAAGTSAAATEAVPKTASAEPLSRIARIMAGAHHTELDHCPALFRHPRVRRHRHRGVAEKFRRRKRQGRRRPPIDQRRAWLRSSRALSPKHPRLNATWAGDNIRTNPEINISVAMAVQDGVVGAVIRNANTMPLGEIAAQRRQLSERSRAEKLRPADITGGTFTISNLGMFDVDSFTAIITPPQAAILAVGKIVDRVVAVDGQVVIRPMLNVTLSADHRVIDGARAAEFLNTLAGAILKPNGWLA